jgi:hypothetical protein
MSEANPFAASETPQVPVAAKTSGLATASLVLGLLGLCLSVLAGLPAIILGIVALVKISGSQGRLRGTGFAITGLVFGCLSTLCGPALLLPAVQAVREAARRNASGNSLRQMGLAAINFESTQSVYPPACANQQGEGPNLSWRVHLLPYLEYQNLYEQFNLDEPWDSPNNKALIPLMPDIYGNPNGGMAEGETNYLAVTGSETMFPGGPRGIPSAAISDGQSNTLMFVEADADQAVVWTKPDDLEFDPNNPKRGLGNYRPGNVILGVFADGHVQSIPAGVDDEAFTAIVTPDGGEVIGSADIYSR